MFNRIILSLILALLLFISILSISIYRTICNIRDQPNPDPIAYYRCGGTKNKPIYCPIPVKQNI